MRESKIGGKASTHVSKQKKNKDEIEASMDCPSSEAGVEIAERRLQGSHQDLGSAGWGVACVALHGSKTKLPRAKGVIVSTCRACSRGHLSVCAAGAREREEERPSVQQNSQRCSCLTR